MAKSLIENLGAVKFDKVIAASEPMADVFTVTVRKLASGDPVVYERGTILALSTGTAGDGKMVILGTEAAENETLTANCVLCDDVEVSTAADVTALAYRTGHLNRERLIAAKSYSLKPEDEEALRVAGIILSDAIEG